jgi:hypothetical protein
MVCLDKRLRRIIAAFSNLHTLGDHSFCMVGERERGRERERERERLLQYSFGL